MSAIRRSLQPLLAAACAIAAVACSEGAFNPIQLVASASRPDLDGDGDPDPSMIAPEPTEEQAELPASLQLLHVADGEARGQAVVHAPRLSALVAKFRAEMPECR